MTSGNSKDVSVAGCAKKIKNGNIPIILKLIYIMIGNELWNGRYSCTGSLHV